MLYSILLSVMIMLNGNIDLNNSIHPENSGDVIVRVKGLESMKGEILVGIYKNKRTFRKVKKVYKYAVKAVENGEEVLVLEDVPAGTYAIALFQDYNGNRKFDKNFMGYPKEPFGFSTNYIVKRRAPKFKEVTFDHSGTTELDIEMQIW